MLRLRDGAPSRGGTWCVVRETSVPKRLSSTLLGPRLAMLDSGPAVRVTAALSAGSVLAVGLLRGAVTFVAGTY